MSLDIVTLFASRRRDGAPLIRHPIVTGVPLPRGACHDLTAIGAQRPNGDPMPLQAKALDRWADGSVRWALIDLQVDIESAQQVVAQIGTILPRLDPPTPLAAHEDGRAVSVGTGRLRATVAPAESGAGVWSTLSTPDLDVDLTLVALAHDGSTTRVSTTRAVVEERGPLRAVVRVDGTIGEPSDPLLNLVVRLHFYADHAFVRIDVQVTNPRAAVHRGGCWDLGDARSVFLKGLTVVATPRTGRCGRLLCSPAPDHPLAPQALPFLLHQDSSGGENWRSTNHLNRHREVRRAFRGYRLHSGREVHDGLRATPVVVADGDDVRLSVAMEHFWQNFPKAIASDGRAIELHLFPPHDLDLHEIQPGERKTHSFHLEVGAGAPSSSLEWIQNPPVVHVDPSYCAATGAVRYLTVEEPQTHDPRLALINNAIEGPDAFANKREIIDEYGWRHFGDIYGDHEAVRQTGPTPLVSHYNNQYDAIEGFAIQFLQSGDRRWWHAMRELAWHVADIDLYHTDRDKTAYNRGLFWHTVHYVDAGTATHRTYPSAFGHGGGPANEHNYTSGLTLAWFLTGERPFLEAALDLAEYPIRIDDGERQVFRWLAAGDTGLATASGTPDYHGPGRGSANSLNALLDGYRLTEERRYLAKAEQIIRRVVHPADDIARHTLLDAERRWFYTMFLQALGRYLDDKEEWGQRDDGFSWARGSLLHYARWMARHEYPYLDKPEILEFPTESWAASDIRKSDVFHHAERHAETLEERALFRERASFFFHSSTTTLAAAPTRALARPVVVLLTSGRLHAWFDRRRDALESPSPVPPATFGSPHPFEPQKVRALRRARLLGALAVLVCMLGLIVAIAWMA